MRLSPVREHVAHEVLRSVNTGNYCGKRLATVTVRCTNWSCNGAVISCQQWPVRAGQRPEKRRKIAIPS